MTYTPKTITGTIAALKRANQRSDKIEARRLKQHLRELRVERASRVSS